MHILCIEDHQAISHYREPSILTCYCGAAASKYNNLTALHYSDDNRALN